MCITATEFWIISLVRDLCSAVLPPVKILQCFVFHSISSALVLRAPLVLKCSPPSHLYFCSLSCTNVFLSLLLMSLPRKRLCFDSEQTASSTKSKPFRPMRTPAATRSFVHACRGRPERRGVAPFCTDTRSPFPTHHQSHNNNAPVSSFCLQLLWLFFPPATVSPHDFQISHALVSA